MNTKAVSKKALTKAVKAPGTSVIAWEAEMAEAAVAQSTSEKARGGSKYISTQGGRFKIDGELVEGRELDVVVLEAIHENSFYKERYDPDDPKAPNCYAFTNPKAKNQETEISRMAPHPEAEDKQGAAQGEEQGQTDGNCNDCWANQYGTSDTGKGKACKNIRRLALVTADSLESAEAMEAAEVRFLKVPVTSTNNWGAHVLKVTKELNRPTFGVVTKIKIAPDPKTQFQLLFEFDSLVEFDNELYAATKKKIDDITPLLTAPYPKQEEFEANSQAKAASKKPSKFAGKAGKR